MASRISGIVPLLFITLLCVGFVESGYLALEYFLMKDQTDREIAAEPSAGKPVQRQKTVAAEKKYDYRIILQRNLFGEPSSAKVTDVVESKPVEDLEATSLKIALKGTIDGIEENDRAIILDQKDKTQKLYQKGDGIQGAFVKEILRGRVILTYNGNDEVLDMSDTAGEADLSGPVAVTPRVGPGVTTPSDVPNARSRPARRVRKPRIIRPIKPVAGA